MGCEERRTRIFPRRIGELVLCDRRMSEWRKRERRVVARPTEDRRVRDRRTLIDRRSGIDRRVWLSGHI